MATSGQPYRTRDGGTVIPVHHDNGLTSFMQMLPPPKLSAGALDPRANARAAARYIGERAARDR